MHASKNKNRFPVWPCVAAASIPVAYIFAYMAIGRLFPQWDPAEYMETGLGIYNIFVDQGWIEGLKGLYIYRGWRPTLTAVLIVPFYALTGGKALAAMHIMCPVLYAVFMSYVVLLLRSVLRGIGLVFALLLTGTHITLVTVGLNFWSELPYCVASAAAVYHFYRCDYFRERQHSIAAGVALGLALCFRPIVGLGTFAAPLAVFLYLSVRKGTIGWRDLGVWLYYAGAVATIAALLYLLPNSKSWTGLILLGFLIVATVALIGGIRRRLDLSANNLYLVSAAFALTVGWFGLFAAELISWTLTNTFGDLVRVTLTMFPHPREAPLAFMRVIARNTVTAPSLGVLGVVAAAALLLALREKKWPLPGPTAALVGAMCIVPLLGTLGTYNGDPRYLTVPAFVLVLSCTAWFLKGAGSGASTALRIALLSPALVVQVVFLASKMVPLPEDTQNRLDRRLLTPIFPLPMPAWRERLHPAEPVYEQIVESVRGSSETTVGVLIPRAFIYLTLPVVNVLAAENRQNLILSMVSEKVPPEYGINEESRVRYLRRTFTHVLIGPLGVWETVPDPVRSVGNYLMDRKSCHENARVLVPAMDSDDVREFILVRIDESENCGV